MTSKRNGIVPGYDRVDMNSVGFLPRLHCAGGI